jgi:hypothetical protein
MNRWWWVSFYAVSLWSVEERRARMALFGVSLAIFVVLYPTEITLLSMLGVEDHLGALLACLCSVAPGVALARPICERLDPELIRNGDARAEQRLASSNHPRC